MRSALRALRTVTTLRDPAPWFVRWSQGASDDGLIGSAGALTIPAFFACVRNISEDVGMLPLRAVERIEPRGTKTLYDHPAHRLVHDEANDEMSAMALRETLTAHALTHKGGFAEIVRDGLGRPAALYPLDPNAVEILRDRDKRLFYRVGGVPLRAADVLHIHGLGFDGVTGYLLSKMGRHALSALMGGMQFNAKLFKNGVVPSGYVSHPGSLSDKAFARLREDFETRHVGEENAWKPIILEEGMGWKESAFKPSDAQMIEALQHGIEEVCRLFRMPPHKVQHLLRATFSNIDAQNVEYVLTLLPWLVRWEQELNRKLLTPAERKTIAFRHTVRGLLRGDLAAQSSHYREMLTLGVYSPNDVRDYEDLNPYEGGDTYFIPSTMMPVPLAARGAQFPNATAAAAKAEADEPDKPDDEDDTPEPAPEDENARAAERLVEAHTPVLAGAYARLYRVETEKLERARKRDDVDAWLPGFTTEHEAFIRQALIDPLLCFASTFAVTVKVDAKRDLNPFLAACVENQLHGLLEAARDVPRPEPADRAQLTLWNLIAYLCATE